MKKISGLGDFCLPLNVFLSRVQNGDCNMARVFNKCLTYILKNKAVESVAVPRLLFGLFGYKGSTGR